MASFAKICSLLLCCLLVFWGLLGMMKLLCPPGATFSLDFDVNDVISGTF